MMNGLRRKKAWGRKVDPYLLIKAVNAERPLTSLKTRLFPRRHVNNMVGLPKTLIDENPAIRGHDLCFDKKCQ